MTIGFLFWLLMVLWAIFGVGGVIYDGPYRGRIMFGGNLLLFVLLFLVGWRLFGFIIQG